MELFPKTMQREVNYSPDDVKIKDKDTSKHLQDTREEKVCMSPH